jgi:hypothetical protein
MSLRPVKSKNIQLIFDYRIWFARFEGLNNFLKVSKKVSPNVNLTRILSFRPILPIQNYFLSYILHISFTNFRGQKKWNFKFSLFQPQLSPN